MASATLTDIGEKQIPPSLSHLKLLETESIHIFREVAAEFEKPVMLYSIGKDSSVMLRLAQKAFYPGPIPFPLLHVDTGYKFREMLEFRDAYTRSLGLNLLVWRNEAALADGFTKPETCLYPVARSQAQDDRRSCTASGDVQLRQASAPPSRCCSPSRC